MAEAVASSALHAPSSRAPSDAPSGSISRRRIRPTGRAIALLVFGVAAILAAYLLPLPQLLVAGLAALLPLPIGLLLVLVETPAFAVRRGLRGGDARVSRLVPGMVAVGDELEVELELAGPRRRRTPPTRIADEVAELAPEWIGTIGQADGRPRRSADDDGVVELPTMPRGGRAEVRYLVRPGRRGAHRIGPLFAEATDPFGLFRILVPLGERTPIVVIPRIEPLDLSGLDGDGDRGDLMVRHRLLNSSEDDLATRGYRPGDPLRRVHWRQSARLGELMVRQEEARSLPRARLLLDTRADGTTDAKQFERMLEVAASLVVALLDHDCVLRLELSGDGTVFDAAPGTERVQELLLALAVCGTVAEPAGDTAPETPATVSAAVPTILIAGRPSPAAIDALPRVHPESAAALALLIAPGSAGAGPGPLRGRLTGAGWSVALLEASDPLSSAIADFAVPAQRSTGMRR